MVCTNPNCRKDCPYAEAPNPRTFKCYECRLISDMMSAGQKPRAGVPRPLKVGDKVRRYKDGRDEPVMYTVLEVYKHEFTVRAADLSPTYTQHCVRGRFPYWEHEDGSPIIPPPKEK